MHEIWTFIWSFDSQEFVFLIFATIMSDFKAKMHQIPLGELTALTRPLF